MNPARNLYWSIVRTVVPMGVAWAVGAVTDNFGPVLDAETQPQLLALGYLAASAVYYVLARLLERVKPRLSFLLGDFRPGSTEPVYPAAPPAP